MPSSDSKHAWGMCVFDANLPDLSFPGLSFGPKETPWNLKHWLYRGGALTRTSDVTAMIETGQLGHPMVERIELVRLIREWLLDYLEGGGRREMVRSCLDKLKLFIQWADNTVLVLSLATVEEC